jgi:hypothetical protein
VLARCAHYHLSSRVSICLEMSVCSIGVSQLDRLLQGPPSVSDTDMLKMQIPSESRTRSTTAALRRDTLEGAEGDLEG